MGHGRIPQTLARQAIWRCDNFRANQKGGTHVGSASQFKAPSILEASGSGSVAAGKRHGLRPFRRLGLTLAAAEAVGYQSIGIEKDPEYFRMACNSIPRLAAFEPKGSI